MATRETIIKINLENQDAIRQLGKWEADLIAVRQETRQLNKDVKEQGSATAEQERQLGILRSTAKNLSGNIRELSNETSGLTASGMRFRDKMADATLEAIKQSGVLGQLAARSDTLTKEIAELNASYKAGTVTQAEYNRQQDILQKELGETNARMTTMDARLDELNKDFRTGKISAEQFKAGVQSVNAEVAKASGAFTKGVADLKSYALGFIGVIAAARLIGGAISNAIQITADFDKAQSRLAGILGTTKDGMKELTDQAMELGRSTAFTASQVSDAQTELAKLGFNQQEIRDSTAAVLDLAAAAGTDLPNAAVVAASTIRGFGLDASEAGRVTDVMAKSFTISSLDISKFSSAMATVAPVANAAGVSLERTTSLLGILTDRGIDASTAGTSLRNIFLELSKRGMTWEEAMQQINSATDRNAAALDLFGKRGATAGSILAGAAGEADEFTEALLRAEGAARDLAAAMLDNLEGDKLKLTSAWEGFILAVDKGDGVISKVLRRFTQDMTNIISDLTEAQSIVETLNAIMGGPASIQQRAIKNAQKALDEYSESTSYAKRTTAELETELAELVKTREAFVKVGKEEAAAEGDLKIAVLEKFVSMRKQREEQERLNATLAAEVDETGRVVEASAKRKKAKEEEAKVVRVLTDELRAFLKAQKDIEQGIGIGRMDVLGGIGSQTPIAAPEDRPTPGADLVEDLSTNLQEVDKLTTDYQNLFMNMSTSIGQSLGEAFAGVEDSNKKILLSILETVRAAIRLYLTQLLAKEVSTKGFAGIASAAGLSVIVEAAFAIAMNSVKGFATGGVVRQSDGPRYTKNPGDTVLISARPGEVVMNEEQQRMANAMAGFNIFKATRVPGFDTGGLVRGTALVNNIAPRPQPSDLNSTRNAMAMAGTPIFVRVTEINQVQGIVARVAERGTL